MENPSIVNVDDFFDKIVLGYTLFGRSAATLATEIPLLSPQAIQLRCRQLDTERRQLSMLDAQLIDILNLAGNDVATSEHVTQYRDAFSIASLAIEDLQCQLFLLRESLQEVTRH